MKFPVYKSSCSKNFSTLITYIWNMGGPRVDSPKTECIPWLTTGQHIKTITRINAIVQGLVECMSEDWARTGRWENRSSNKTYHLKLSPFPQHIQELFDNTVHQDSSHHAVCTGTLRRHTWFHWLLTPGPLHKLYNYVSISFINQSNKQYAFNFNHTSHMVRVKKIKVLKT